MVIDAAKGIEARTRKLFEVCRLRDIPIVTFINKMDRESRDPFELLDEIEKTLALDTAPMTWPIGRGRDFAGTYDIATRRDAAAERGRQDGGAAAARSRRARREKSHARRRRDRGRAGAGQGCLPPLRFRLVPRGPPDAGVLRLGPEELRRQGSARRARRFRAAAARAGLEHAHGRRARERDDGLRLQDPGQHGPQSPRPHRLCAALLRQAAPRHEGEAHAHRKSR